MRAVCIATLAGTVALLPGCTNHGFDSSPTDPFGTSCHVPDCDKDGYPSPADCNDANPRINPEAYDFPGDGVDDDCDGKVDDPVESCEVVPSGNPGSPTDFARSADLCAQRSKTLGGVVFDPLVSAKWGSVRGYGPGQRLWTSETKAQQVGIVSSFGDNKARRGLTMIGLSNGPWGTHTPRESAALDDPDFRINDACKEIPLGALDCASLSNGSSSGGLSVQDWAELALTVKVPSNARAMVFDFSFFTTEFSQFWNSALNDAFFVLVTSNTLAGANVAKDANGFAITVNSGFFQLCPKPPGPPGLSPDKSAALAHCVGVAGDASQGVFGSLAGTFFDGAGSAPFDGTALSADGTKMYMYGGGSGWLTGKFPVTPGETLSMRIIVHDTFDGLKDSAVLFDAIRWEAVAPVDPGVSRPPN